MTQLMTQAAPAAPASRGPAAVPVVGPVRVDVAVCTFRRETVVETLRSLAAQDLPPGWAMRVIVADNDDTPSAQRLVEEASRDLGLNVLYLHAPARNISIARNACLEAATAPLMAFLDDDEIASPSWLRSLVEEVEASGADVVFGSVRAVYAPDAKAWLREADLHSTGPAIRGGGRIYGGYAGNVILRRSAVGDLRFDPGLGRSGGEDTDFFLRLQRAGIECRYRRDAVAYEPVPPQRARLAWLLRRSFRIGQTQGRILAAGSSRRMVQIALAASKVLYCLFGAGARIASPAGWRRSLVRGAMHAGVIAYLLGKREVDLY